MFRKLLPHVAIVMAFMYIVFFLIDRVNTAMNFVNNSLTKGILLAMCLLVVIESIVMIADDRRKERARTGRARRAPAAAEYRERPAARDQGGRPQERSYGERPAVRDYGGRQGDRAYDGRSYGRYGGARTDLYRDDRYDRYRGSRSRFTEDGARARSSSRGYTDRTANYGQKRGYY